MLTPSLFQGHKGIALVDANSQRKDAVHRSLTNARFAVQAFSSIETCLHNAGSWGGCLVVDFALNRFGDIPKALADQGLDTPVLYLDDSARTDEITAAVKAGAFDFLCWPRDKDSLASRIVQAVEADLGRQRMRSRVESVLERFHRLTRRQRQVMHLVALGHPNKIVSAELGISERTVEVHRAAAMRRTGAESLAQMVVLDLAASCFENRASWSLDHRTHGLETLVDMIAPQDPNDDRVDGRRVA